MGVLGKCMPSWTRASAAEPFPLAQCRHHPVCAQMLLLCSLGDGNMFSLLRISWMIPVGLLGGAGTSFACWPSPF